jgi:hypothetical protein
MNGFESVSSISGPAFASLTANCGRQSMTMVSSRSAALIYSDIGRQICFGITAALFVLIAIRAMVAPRKMAAGIGYKISTPNGYSELFAVYVGIWLATAGLALLALVRVKEALLGDLLALFVLAQPAGRFLALLKWGPPQGTLYATFVVEAVGGVALLLVRPAA